MKSGTTIKNILILLIVGLGIFLIVDESKPAPVVIDTSNYEHLATDYKHEEFQPKFQLADELESTGYKFFPHVSLISDEMSIYVYVRNDEPFWEAKGLVLYILDGEDKNRAEITDRHIFDKLIIEASSYCVNSSCINENPVLAINVCRMKNFSGTVYAINERSDSESEHVTNKIYAAWVVKDFKFVSVLDLSNIECNYSED